MAENKFNLQERIVSDSIFTIGSVVSIKGKDIVVKVNKNKNLPHLFFEGKIIKNVSVGLSNYVKIMKGFTEIICKVEGEYLEEDKYQLRKNYSNEKDKIDRFLNVSAFGFYDNNHKFQHGIKEMPLIGSECRLLSKTEFEQLHQLAEPTGELSIPLGFLIEEESQNISVSVRKLFAGHIGIFGNTGSGKSNTLAKMYAELFKLENLNIKEKSKFIFIDFNGEYSKENEDNILTNTKTVYHLSTKDDYKEKKYPLPKKEIEKLELLSILLDATEKTQKPFLHRAIDNNYFDEDTNHGRKIEKINERLTNIFEKNDKNFNVPFLKKYVKDFEELGFKISNTNNRKDLNDLNQIASTGDFYIKVLNPEKKEEENHYYKHYKAKFISEKGYLNPLPPEGNNFSALQKIQFKILDQYYYEILNGYANQEHISPLISRLKKRFDMLNKIFNITDQGGNETSESIQIINLKNVDLEIKKIIPLLICKASYDEQKNKRDTDKENSLHIIIDEAHNILSENSNRESESWKDYRLETFEEIIKEGRKFGVFLTVASQRPSDISPTIISQLHNYFIHRLMNENDLRAINKAVSYLDKLSFDSISNLSTGCCFIAGQMTQFPLSIQVELLDENERPQSQTIDLNALWKEKEQSVDPVQKTAETTYQDDDIPF